MAKGIQLRTRGAEFRRLNFIRTIITLIITHIGERQCIVDMGLRGCSAMRWGQQLELSLTDLHARKEEEDTGR
eukprot:1148374-Pelagomonas_calceolata.AAC.3